MLIFLAKRAVYMVLTMIVVSILLFLLLEVNGDSVAVKVLGPYTSEEQRNIWLEQNGYFRPIYVRYFEWLFNIVSGDFGDSIRFKVPVGDVLWPRLANTALLGASVFVVMVPVGLLFGVLAGMQEGSLGDRVLTVVSVVMREWRLGRRNPRRLRRHAPLARQPERTPILRSLMLIRGRWSRLADWPRRGDAILYALAVTRSQRTCHTP